MLQRLWERRRDDEGFTLIELMVVVLIIGILIAIALPTFLGARQRAQDRAAQSDLRNAMAAAKAYYTEGDTYAGLDSGTPLAISSYETSLDFITGASDLTNQDVSVDVSSDGTQVGFARMSASGTCFWIMDDASGSDAGTYYGTGTTCTGTAALGATGSSW